MRPPELKSDCDNCVALCCVAPNFARSDKFGFSKPEGVACRNLAGDFRCTIHASLAASGFQGCVDYDCFGAGQRVTRRFAAEGNWRDREALKERMFAVYHVLRPLHELMVYLTELRDLTADPAIRGGIDGKLEEIDGLARLDENELRALDVRPHRDAVERLIGRVRATR